MTRALALIALSLLGAGFVWGWRILWRADNDPTIDPEYQDWKRRREASR